MQLAWMPRLCRVLVVSLRCVQAVHVNNVAAALCVDIVQDSVHKVQCCPSAINKHVSSLQSWKHGRPIELKPSMAFSYVQ